jgi:hypothetical protein
MAMVAKGEVEIGLTFVSEITTEPGVEAVARCHAHFTDIARRLRLAYAKSADLARAAHLSVWPGSRGNL